MSGECCVGPVSLKKIVMVYFGQKSSRKEGTFSRNGRSETLSPTSSLRSQRSPPPKVLSKQQIQRKQQNLSSSLREAETKQLTQYLKNRSMLLDEEINQTREKLNLNLNPAPDSPKLNLTRGRSEMSSPKKKNPSRLKNDEELEIETYHKEEYELKYLLKRLLQCIPLLLPPHTHLLSGMEDSQMTPSQITSCFIPSQHMKFHQVGSLSYPLLTPPSSPPGRHFSERCSGDVSCRPCPTSFQTRSSRKFLPLFPSFLLSFSHPLSLISCC
jgi:hypothetical protein